MNYTNTIAKNIWCFTDAYFGVSERQTEQASLKDYFCE